VHEPGTRCRACGDHVECWPRIRNPYTDHYLQLDKRRREKHEAEGRKEESWDSNEHRKKIKQQAKQDDQL
jgi:hypothetical protein